MDNLTSKYIIFAIGLFITIIIATLVFSTYGEVKGIYEGVNETNISIKDLYDDINIQYNDTTQNGVDLVNTIKKFENERYIEVVYPYKTEVVKILEDISDSHDYEREVDVLIDLIEGKESTNQDFIYKSGGIQFPYKYSSIFTIIIEKSGNKTIIKFN